MCPALFLCTVLGGCCEEYINNTGNHQVNGTLWNPPPSEDMGARSRVAKTNVAILGRVQMGRKKQSLEVTATLQNAKVWFLIFPGLDCPGQLNWYYDLSDNMKTNSDISWRLEDCWLSTEVRAQESPKSAEAGQRSPQLVSTGCLAPGTGLFLTDATHNCGF